MFFTLAMYRQSCARILPLLDYKVIRQNLKVFIGYSDITALIFGIYEDHIKLLKIPAFAGAMIGHIKDKFTVPVGLEATIDAQKGSITLSEAAVNK